MGLRVGAPGGSLPAFVLAELAERSALSCLLLINDGAHALYRPGFPGDADDWFHALTEGAPVSRKSCGNACSNPGGIRRHVAAPGGLEAWTERTQTASSGSPRSDCYCGSEQWGFGSYQSPCHPAIGL